MFRDFWRSLQGAPRGHNKVLAVAAWSRLVAILAVSLRLLYDTAPVPELPQPATVTRIFVVAAMTYAIALLFTLRFARSWFFTMRSKAMQVLIDIAIFWLAQFLVHSTKSDIYYLNLIPMVIAVEFFPFFWAFNVFALIIVGHWVLLDRIQPGQPMQIWVRDFLPRSYIFLVINAIFFTQRQMRTEPERNLENDREEIIASVRQQLDKVPGVDRNYINRLERRLDKFIDKTELYRRMYPRRIDDGGEELDYSRILGAFDDSADGGLREQADNPMHLAREAFEELAKALHCAAAIFRVENTMPGGGSRLDVEFAWGCGAKQIKERHASIAEGKDSLAWRAFRSNRIETWTQSKSNSPAKQFANLDFIGECGIRSALSAPMILLGRRGLVSLYRAEPTRFMPAEQAEIQATLDLIQVAVEKSYESARLREWLEALRVTAGELTKPANEQEILDYVVKQVQAVFRARVRCRVLAKRRAPQAQG